MRIPKVLTNAYVNSAWQAYNQGLTQLVRAPDRVKGPVIATKCGHFIQQEDPVYVAEELDELFDKMLRN